MDVKKVYRKMVVLVKYFKMCASSFFLQVFLFRYANLCVFQNFSRKLHGRASILLLVPSLSSLECQ